jgi:uncharacterized protein (DUF924 family)
MKRYGIERARHSGICRIKGELLLQDGHGAMAAAEEHFWQALDWARRQDALSWELRAATSLAQLLRDQIPRTRWHVSSRSTLGSARASHSRPQEARALLDALP